MMKNKVITILEAQVPEENWAVLKNAYETRATVLPPEIVESFLVQGKEDPTLWRIITVWKSLEHLQAMRASGQTPTGVLIFRDAGTEPSLKIFEVKAFV